MKADFRIKRTNGTYLNTCTGLDSWFTLEKARSTNKTMCILRDVGASLSQSEKVKAGI